MDNKIKALEKKMEQRWEHLELLERCRRREEELDLKEQAEITQKFIELERARWSTTYRIIQFLKDSATEEEL